AAAQAAAADPRAGIAQVAVDGGAPAKRTADRHRGSRPCPPVCTPAAGARAAPVGVRRTGRGYDVVRDEPVLRRRHRVALVHRPLRAGGPRAQGDPQAEGAALRAGSSAALAVLTAIFGARPLTRSP